MKNLLFLSLFSLLLSTNITAQDAIQYKVDSLLQLAEGAKTDKDKAKHYFQAGMSANRISPELALTYFKQADRYFEQLPNSILNARNQDWMGYIYFRLAEVDSAEIYYLKGIQSAEALDSTGWAGEFHHHYVMNCLARQNKRAEATAYMQGLVGKFENSEDATGQIQWLRTLGDFSIAVSEYDQAVDYHKRALEIAKKHQLTKDIAQQTSLLARTYFAKCDMPSAVYYNFEALKLLDEKKDIFRVAETYSDLGDLFALMKEFDKSLIHFNKSIEIANAFGDDRQTAITLVRVYSNMGDNLYTEMGNYKKALECHHKSRQYNELAGVKELNDTWGPMRLAKAHRLDGNLDSARHYYNIVWNIHNTAQRGELRTQAFYLTYLGEGYAAMGKEAEAEPLLNRSAHIADSLSIYFMQQRSHYLLYELYKAKNQHAKALTHFEKYFEVFSYIYSPEHANRAIAGEMTYEFDKKEELERIQQELKDLAASEAMKQQKIIRNVIAGGLLLVVAFLAFVFNRLKVTRKQKAIIEETHAILEERNQEIMDSITYAKRIQSAILPPNKIVKEYLRESFILYKPKDIVAGDFYWLEHRDGKVLFAAADCTGHGVPGAMVSVVCNNGLNRSVREYGLTDPGQILDKTRELVIQEFNKSEDDVKDGMDIALCSLEGNTLQYSGAHNPLWIVRNGEILETKADKEPIGQFDKPTPYTTHTIELQKGDAIYIFSDGYVDQFGGEKGKKLKSKGFKTLLLSIQDQPMEEQRNTIDLAFETWREGIEQIDDVCVIGVTV